MTTMKNAPSVHLQDELLKTKSEVVAETRYGRVRGGRASNGAAVFLEVPYAKPPVRFQDPEPLPADWRYEDKEYIYETSYAFQPTNDGQAAGVPVEDKVGLGKPTENPLFLNIVCPPAFPSRSGFPVKVYIHGGFLQFGSPHGLGSQAQYVSVERSEVWVNIGYRLSAFGFLACDEPKIDGNFGFKDQWLALQWVKENILAFGGDPNDIQISGLSAGAHSVHQLLHYTSRLPEGEIAPFHSAVLQSNAIVISPRTPVELRSQFQALCRALHLDPSDPEIVAKLRDPLAVPATAITHAIDADALGIPYGTFRGCLDGHWLSSSPDPMTWQRSGGFARALLAKGVRAVVVGDLTEEWYLYSIAHPLSSMDDITLNLDRYYQREFVSKIMAMYRVVPEGAPIEEYEKLFGEISSALQVHLPVRMLARDLVNAGYPVLRYEIRWTPEQIRPLGYVTHGTDRPLWALRIPTLTDEQLMTARQWLDAIARETDALKHKPRQSARDVLVLTEEREIKWMEDIRWEEMMKLSRAVPGEE